MSSALTFELLIQSSSTCHAERTNEFLEVDMPVLILVEYVEDIVGEFAWISEREELLVYPTELVLVELTRGTVL